MSFTLKTLFSQIEGLSEQQSQKHRMRMGRSVKDCFTALYGFPPTKIQEDNNWVCSYPGDFADKVKELVGEYFTALLLQSSTEQPPPTAVIKEPAKPKRRRVVAAGYERIGRKD